MTRYILILISLSIAFLTRAQPAADSISHSFFFIGDCGELFVNNSPIGEVFRKKISDSGPNTSVIYLGDNIYPAGLPEESSLLYSRKQAIIQTQVDWIKDLNAQGIFIPGNHDWSHWGEKGLQHINNQQRWIDSLKNSNVKFFPRDGCPGPVAIPINNKVVLIILDTQWFLHQWSKPEGEESYCDAKTAAEVLSLIADIFRRNKTKRIIVAGHHPLITYGIHGGVSTVKNHLFPLTDWRPNLYIPMPIIGSLYPLYRKFIGTIQDTKHPIYKKFARGIQKILNTYPGSVYVSGHEHALQYIQKDSVHYIVSGSGAKITPVKKKGYAQFAESINGFAQIAIHYDGTASLYYYQADAEFPQGRIIFYKKLR